MGSDGLSIHVDFSQPNDGAGVNIFCWIRKVIVQLMKHLHQDDHVPCLRVDQRDVRDVDGGLNLNLCGLGRILGLGADMFCDLYSTICAKDCVSP